MVTMCEGADLVGLHSCGLAVCTPVQIFCDFHRRRYYGLKTLFVICPWDGRCSHGGSAFSFWTC